MLGIRQDIAARLSTAFRLTFILLFLEFLVYLVLSVSLDYGYVFLTGDFESSLLYVEGTFFMYIGFPFAVAVVRFVTFNYLFVFLLFAAFLEDEEKLTRMIALNTIAYLVSLTGAHMSEGVAPKNVLLSMYMPNFPLYANVGLFSLSAMLISPVILIYGSRHISKKIFYPTIIVLAISSIVAAYATA